jgi:hypothetical protein
VLLDAVMARVGDDRQRRGGVDAGLIWLGAGQRTTVRRWRSVSSIDQYDDGVPAHALITAENALLRGIARERSVAEAIRRTHCACRRPRHSDRLKSCLAEWRSV